MHTKMLALAEKLEHRSRCSDTEDFSEMYNMLAHDIRSIFTPRDWREGCVVERKPDGCWAVESPSRECFIENGPLTWAGNVRPEVGNFSTESSARAALASCTTPYPGYKENTCGKTSTDSQKSSPTSQSPSSSAPASGPSSGGSSSESVPSATTPTHDTLTFGGPALRVAFHFDGDRLVRWEILEQREELRGKSRLSGCVFSEVYPIIMSGGTTCIHGAIRSLDHNYKIEGTHTRATITALGREIDQVNREWCEKLGIVEKAQPGVLMDAVEASVYVRKLEDDLYALRRQLDAAEKVMRSFADPSVAWVKNDELYTNYLRTYPKTGGAQ